jgi:HPt (histidine-containing phosphotransfer) domain-containing protein
MLDLAPAPADPAFDEPARALDAYAALVAEIGEDGASEVRAVFWSETRSRLDLFDTLALEPHRARIAREAHSLKSAAGTFGYLRLAALARQLEKSAETATEDDVRNLLVAMRSAFLAALALEPQT